MDDLRVGLTSPLMASTLDRTGQGKATEEYTVVKKGDKLPLYVGDCDGEFVNDNFVGIGMLGKMAFCTQDQGHEGKHYAQDANGVVVEVWD